MDYQAQKLQLRHVKQTMHQPLEQFYKSQEKYHEKLLKSLEYLGSDGTIMELLYKNGVFKIVTEKPISFVNSGCRFFCFLDGKILMKSVTFQESDYSQEPWIDVEGDKDYDFQCQKMALSGKAANIARNAAD